MFLTDIPLLLFIIHIICGVEPDEETSRSVHALGDGHGKPFGKGRPSTHVPVVSHSIMGKEFFSKYVSAQNPVVLKGLIKDSPAISLWSDDYFLNLENVPENHTVLIEYNKKENRTDPATQMSLKDFVKVYNDQPVYMVDSVPEFLRGDIQIPSVLQCPQLLRTALVETMMWFSSGGTSSVVHTDSVENLNCIIAGSKRFVFVPHEYKKFVPLERIKGSFSDIDVDAVDYDKYPGLAKVEFQHADVEAGDCLYIPYLLIHQVRSFHRSIAVNIWWNSTKNEELNLDECNTDLDLSLRLSHAKIDGMDSHHASQIRDVFIQAMEYEAFDIDRFTQMLDLLNGLDKGSERFNEAMKYTKEIFEELDVDSNGYVGKDDVYAVTSDGWNTIYGIINMAEEAESNDQSIQYADDAHDEL